MPLQFTVTLSGRDYAEANWLMVRRLWLRRWGWTVPLIGIGLGLLLASAARHLHPETSDQRLRSLVIKGFLFAIAFAGLQLFILLRVILLAGRPLPGSSATQTLAYHGDATGLGLSINGHSQTWPWARFRHVIEDDRWLLLSRGGMTFCAFPKSQLDAGVLLALKQALNPS